MGSAGGSNADLCALQVLFRKACQETNGDGERCLYAEKLAEIAMDAARSGNSKNCEALLGFVISCFDSPEGFTVMDSILFEVFSPLLNCSHVSQTCHESFQRLIGIITERCTAREVIVLLLAALDDRPGYFLPTNGVLHSLAIANLPEGPSRKTKLDAH